jgi:YD repeat-containing protein
LNGLEILFTFSPFTWLYLPVSNAALAGAQSELVTQAFPSDTSAQAITYDAAGNVLSITDSKGKTTTYSYDTRNQLLSETPDPSLSDSAVTFTYTPTGQVATMTDSGGTITYIYDSQDRVISKATPVGTLTYSYDAAGNLIETREHKGDIGEP